MRRRIFFNENERENKILMTLEVLLERKDREIKGKMTVYLIDSNFRCFLLVGFGATLLSPYSITYNKKKKNLAPPNNILLYHIEKSTAL